MDQATLASIEQNGYDDTLQGAEISDNPYTRGTKEFEAWRAGWAYGNHAIWQGVHMSRQKVSTE